MSELRTDGESSRLPADIKTLYDRFFALLCLFACKFVTDRTSAEDIVQEAFMKLYLHPGSFETIPQVRSFLHIVVRNDCYKLIRQENRLRGVREDYIRLLPDHELPDHADKQWQLAISESLVFEAMRQLPKMEGQVFELVCIRKKSLAEAAGLLDNSVNTVRNQLRSARKKMRILLKGN